LGDFLSGRRDGLAVHVDLALLDHVASLATREARVTSDQQQVQPHAAAGV
jgi:hypothetical protein